MKMINSGGGDTDHTYLKLIIWSDVDKQMNHSARVKHDNTIRDTKHQLVFKQQGSEGITYTQWGLLFLLLIGPCASNIKGEL